MEVEATSSCPNCQRLQARLDSLQEQLKALQVAFAQLQAQLAAARKNSSTSSKPPSSDIVKGKPAGDADAAKRSIGGQPGHPMHRREPFAPELVTHFEEHVLDGCPCCGGE